MKYFDKEMIDKLNDVPLIDLAERLGMSVIRQGRVYSTKEYDSLKIYEDKNTFYRFSNGSRGKAINFVMEFENRSFLDAANLINDLFSITKEDAKQNNEYKSSIKRDAAINSYNHTIDVNHQAEKRDIEIPKFTNKMGRTYAYLIKQRGIDKSVIDICVRLNILREEEKHHNICFLGRDEKGKIEYIAVNGSNSNIRFKGEVYGSNKEYGFHIENKKSSVLIVCESPIDMLSMMTFNKNIGHVGFMESFNYLSLGGVSDLALDRFLENNKQITEIELCLDNDKAGYEASEKFIQKYSDRYQISKLMESTLKASEVKDINEYILREKEEEKEIVL